MLPYQYRLTKYNPHERDDRGAFRGDDWSAISDVGGQFGGETLGLAHYLEVEATHLSVVAAFMAEADIDGLTVAGLELQPRRRLGVELSEGRRLAPLEVTDVVRHMLREDVWCRLEAAGRFYVHVGFDYYVFLGCNRPTPASVDRVAAVGLYLDDAFPSPYRPEGPA